jgi:hypothetical protein
MLLSARLERFCAHTSELKCLGRLTNTLISPALADEATWTFYIYPPANALQSTNTPELTAENPGDHNEDHQASQKTFLTSLLPWLHEGTLPLRFSVTEIV